MKLNIIISNLILIFTITSCASTQTKSSIKNEVKSYFTSVGYTDSSWEFGFDHIAPLTFYRNKLELIDENTNITILFRDIIDIKYKNGTLLNSQDQIIITHIEQGNEVKSYFTTLESLGWAWNTDQIYTSLLYYYKKYNNEINADQNP